MVLAQIAATITMALTFSHDSPPVSSIILIEVFVCMFTAGFAYSWGPLGWLVSASNPPLTLAIQYVHLELGVRWMSSPFFS